MNSTSGNTTSRPHVRHDDAVGRNNGHPLGLGSCWYENALESGIQHPGTESWSQGRLIIVGCQQVP
jgi:hypothetical protein